MRGAVTQLAPRVFAVRRLRRCLVLTIQCSIGTFTAEILRYYSTDCALGECHSERLCRWSACVCLYRRSFTHVKQCLVYCDVDPGGTPGGTLVSLKLGP